jgi:hypothetical protein
MKPEKELVWIFVLLSSHFVKGFFTSPEKGCKKDYERLLNAPENNKEFGKWVNDLISEGSLEHSGIMERSDGKRVETYIVNPKFLLERLRNNIYYNPAYVFFDSRSTLGVSK